MVVRAGVKADIDCLVQDGSQSAKGLLKPTAKSQRPLDTLRQP